MEEAASTGFGDKGNKRHQELMLDLHQLKLLGDENYTSCKRFQKVS